MSATHLVRVIHAAQLVTMCPADPDQAFAVGEEAMGHVTIIEDGAMVVGLDGRITHVGTTQEIIDAPDLAEAVFASEVDATGKAILPGLVDGHTHPVWAGDRVHEFAMKLAGMSYMEIHEMGGGIGFTVKHTQEADEDTLLELFLGRLDRMLALGTTLVEAKSGYGLETETELKMLRVITRAQAQHPVEIVSTFCGAHSVPKGSTEAEAARDVVDVQLPAVMAARDSGEVVVDNIDVFMEKNVFEGETTREILEAGVGAGLNINFHGDEINPMHAGELAGDLGALAVSHLEHVTDEGIAAMAVRPTFAVLLPTTAYLLRLVPPPARKLIAGNVPVALGSDFNPNAHCMAMPAVMNMACVTLRMSMEESLNAATINAAASLDRAGDHGSLAVGKLGNFIVVDHADWRHLIYELVDPPLEAVWVKGARAWPVAE